MTVTCGYSECTEHLSCQRYASGIVADERALHVRAKLGMHLCGVRAHHIWPGVHRQSLMVHFAQQCTAVMQGEVVADAPCNANRMTTLCAQCGDGVSIFSECSRSCRAVKGVCTTVVCKLFGTKCAVDRNRASRPIAVIASAFIHPPGAIA